MRRPWLLLLLPVACIDLPPPLRLIDAETPATGGSTADGGTGGEAGTDVPTGGGGAGGLGGSGGEGGAGGAGGAPPASPLPLCNAGERQGCAAIVDMATSDYHTCVLASDGHVWCWGSNLYGQLGDSSLGMGGFIAPRVVPNLDGILEIESGNQHTCARDQGGDVWCWGLNDKGSLGLGHESEVPGPQKALAPAAIMMASGHRTHCVVTTTNEVWCWGIVHGVSGGLFSGTPTKVPGLDDMPPIGWLATGSNTSCVASQDGLEVRCWGGFGDDWIGDGTTTITTIATPVAVGGAVRSLATRSIFCALAGPSFQCWGEGSELGMTDSLVPAVAAHIDGTALDVQLGWRHACLRYPNLDVRCFGYSQWSELGPNGGTGQLVANPVVALTNVSELDVGWQHNCALLANGELRCWGRNQYGQVNPAVSTVEVPQPSLVTF